ncbi:24124_t:CDS:2 [Gigaspora margarita]|uniref:24124_t:CDS:1 n=1 Tax=Gigaspora margarita TaxID=4874 RepID=A0ABM8VZ18_GIGMA|nr:24124_t:CDS:2 [Gigaspora margarita]
MHIKLKFKKWKHFDPAEITTRIRQNLESQNGFFLHAVVSEKPLETLHI